VKGCEVGVTKFRDIQVTLEPLRNHSTQDFPITLASQLHMVLLYNKNKDKVVPVLN